MEEIRDIQLILDEIDQDGYSCSIVKFEGLKFLKLPLKIDLERDQSEIKVTGDLSDHQLPAFDRLCFDYSPEQNDPWVLSDEHTGIVQMYVYYKPFPCPPEGTLFEMITEEGGVIEMWIENGKIHYSGGLFADVTEWSQYDLFVLPYE